MNHNVSKSVSDTQAYNVLRAAQCHEHLGVMASSAKLCAVDAANMINGGEFHYAACRALDSLSYSVGILSPVYQAARASVVESASTDPRPGWVVREAGTGHEGKVSEIDNANRAALVDFRRAGRCEWIQYHRLARI